MGTGEENGARPGNVEPLQSSRPGDRIKYSRVGGGWRRRELGFWSGVVDVLFITSCLQWAPVEFEVMKRVCSPEKARHFIYYCINFALTISTSPYTTRIPQCRNNSAWPAAQWPINLLPSEYIGLMHITQQDMFVLRRLISLKYLIN